MNIYLNFGKKTMLPVLPASFEKQESMNNTEININSLGTVNLLGKRGLKKLEIQSFFPKRNYSFCKCAPERPETYVKRFERAMEKNKVGVCTVTGMGISFRCSIESFNYGAEDGTGDVNYTISLVEYRNVKSERITTKTKPKTYRAKKGDNFYSISRKVFGNSAYAAKIAKANKKKTSYKFKKAKKIKIPAVKG